MNIRHNVRLADYSTMRLGGIADYLADIASTSELIEAIDWANAQGVPVMMIGGGSNIIWRDEGYRGLVLVCKLRGFDSTATDDTTQQLVTIGAGELWDEAVARTVQAGLTGIETLSLIPGTAGGTPVQNVGAYGQEIAQTLVSVEAYDVHTKSIVTIAAADCGFGYRTSRFKTTDKGRFFIVSLTLKLTKGNPQPPFYGALEGYFAAHNTTEFTPQTVREAVIAIRSSKLPDPRKMANNGSFFANPVVSAEEYAQLEADYPELPHWPTADGRVKLPAAWLLERAGFKDYHDPDTGMATYATQPLVLVNEHATSTAQLLQFRQKIVDAIAAQFGITLEQEPEILP
jgi:UDP-N-acetylmuramate dehydrogenase